MTHDDVIVECHVTSFIETHILENARVIVMLNNNNILQKDHLIDMEI